MKRPICNRQRGNLNDVLAVLSNLGLQAVAREGGWNVRNRKLSLEDQLTLWIRANWEGGDDSLATMMLKHNLNCDSADQATEQALSDLDCHRPWELFAHLFEQVAGKADRRLRRHLGKFQILALDGSTVKGLAPRLAQFFPLTSNEGRVLARLKIHMLLDLDTGPRAVKITDANNNDGQHTDFIWKHVRRNRLLVFDLGYWSFDFFDEFERRGACFVSRVSPRNTPVVLKWLRCTDEWRDYVAKLDRYRSAPKEYAVRVIEHKQPDGTWWRWCTNVMDPEACPAEEIADLYRLRWQIEVFFRLLKHVLSLKRVHSTNVNAVLVELFVALIAYLVIHWLIRAAAREYPLPPNRQYCFARAARLVRVLSEQLNLPLSKLSPLVERIAEHCTTIVNKKRQEHRRIADVA
jgi:hypothetical protein